MTTPPVHDPRAQVPVILAERTPVGPSGRCAGTGGGYRRPDPGEVARRFRAGETITGLVRAYRSSARMIKRYLEAAGVTAQERRASVSAVRSASAKASVAARRAARGADLLEREAVVRRMYTDGATIAEIKAAIGRESPAIDNIIRRLGLPLRQPNRRPRRRWGAA